MDDRSLGRAGSIIGPLLTVVLMALTLSLATFLLIRMTPGNSATAIALRRAPTGATAAQIDQLRHELGLHDPLIVQYGRWLSDAVVGEFGVSEQTGQPIRAEIAARLPTTLLLTGGGAGLAIVVGVGAGLASGGSQARLPRTVLRLGALSGASIPPFWLAYLLILFTAERWGWLPTSGSGGVRALILPWVVLAVPAAAAISRVVAVSLRTAFQQPFIVAARARGSSPRSILVRDAGSYIVGPVLNVVGLQLALMLAGTVVVETIFGWAGLGSFFLHAVNLRDTAAIQAVVLVFAVGFLVVNRAVDGLHRLLDPRLRRPVSVP